MVIYVRRKDEPGQRAKPGGVGRLGARLAFERVIQTRPASKISTRNIMVAGTHGFERNCIRVGLEFPGRGTEPRGRRRGTLRSSCGGRSMVVLDPSFCFLGP